MELNLNRLEVAQIGALLTTSEVIEALHTSLEIPEEVSESFLSSWVGLLRSELISLAERRREQGYYEPLESLPPMRLSAGLSPSHWPYEEFRAQISRETQLPAELQEVLIKNVGGWLYEVGKEKAFEPIGWFHRYGGEGFIVRFWADFLTPVTHVPVETVLGLDWTAEEFSHPQRPNQFLNIRADRATPLRPLATFARDQK